MKRLQHIFITNSQGDTFEAIELVGTGLLSITSIIRSGNETNTTSFISHQAADS